MAFFSSSSVFLDFPFIRASIVPSNAEHPFYSFFLSSLLDGLSSSLHAGSRPLSAHFSALVPFPAPPSLSLFLLSCLLLLRRRFAFQGLFWGGVFRERSPSLALPIHSGAPAETFFLFSLHDASRSKATTDDRSPLSRRSRFTPRSKFVRTVSPFLSPGASESFF